MFEKLFLQILNMSFTASFVVVAVVIARLLLKNAPRSISYALWAVVLFRLLCPFSFESVISLLPVKPNPIPQEIVLQQTPQIDTGIKALNQAVNSSLPAATPYASMNTLQGWVAIGTFLWLAGIAVLLLYSVISLLLLGHRLKDAVYQGESVYLSQDLASPFVMGVLRPRIYLPANLSEDEKRYILLHERTHIKRFDHLFKLVGFAALCLHWFNPLVWAAFFLCGQDMEMSCDEAVIKQLGVAVKKDYSSSLLTLATGRRIVGGTPLAFGEGDTKSRIKNVLHYKKPTLWAVVAAVILVIAMSIGFMINPPKSPSVTNIIYTAELSLEQKAALMARDPLATDGDIFVTAFRGSDQLKSYAYYVECYQFGTLVDTSVQAFGNLDDKEGSFVTAFSMNRGESGLWESMRWTAIMPDGNAVTDPAVRFPDGFVPQGVATDTLTNEGNPEEMPKIVPGQPVIIASIGMHSAQYGTFHSYNCTYLMDHPEKIAQYECVYLVKCVFSEQTMT